MCMLHVSVFRELKLSTLNKLYELLCITASLDHILKKKSILWYFCHVNHLSSKTKENKSSCTFS